MYTIAILSQKGGAGKTTLAVNLAVASEIHGKATAIVDLDPQASACTWGDRRKADSPVVTSMQPARLNHALNALQKGGADFVFIDTPPSTEQAAMMAAEAANLILIPCRPAFLDLAAINQTLVHVKSRGKQAVLVFNAVPSSTSAAIEASEAAKAYGVKIAPIHINQRVVFMRTMSDGLGVMEVEPKGKASQEIQEIYNLMLKELKL